VKSHHVTVHRLLARRDDTWQAVCVCGGRSDVGLRTSANCWADQHLLRHTQPLEHHPEDAA
jgi:hypothetical protein